MSTKKKAIIFSSILLTASSGAFIYNLHFNKEFLISTHEKTPWLINAIGPYIGIPIQYTLETPELDFPEELKDIVGEKVKLCCLLKSGKVVTVDALVEDSLKEIKEKNGIEEEVINYEVINKEDEEKIKEIENAFKIKIPNLREDMTKEELKNILPELQLLANDLYVQIEVSKKYNNDITSAEKALKEVNEKLDFINKKTRSSFSFF